MGDDDIAGFEAVHHFDVRRVSVSDVDGNDDSSPVANDVGHPRIARTKDSARWNANDVGIFPDDEVRLEPVAVAQRGPLLARAVDVGDDGRALLFDAERRE